MPAGPGGAGMPACPLGVSVIGWTMEPRAQCSVGRTHRQHTDPWAVLLDQQRPRPCSHLGLLQAPIPVASPPQRSITNAPDPQACRAPHLAASCCDTVNRSPESQTPLKTSSRHLFWMPWALTRPEADRPTPESGRLETTFFMPTVAAQISCTGKQRASLKGCTSQAPLQLRDGQ